MNCGRIRAPISAAQVAGESLLTVLWVQKGYSATKTITPGANGEPPQVRAFNAGFGFDVKEQIPIRSLADLSLALSCLEHEPMAFVVRGAPVAGLDLSKPVHRRGSDAGESFQGNFRTPSQGWQFVMLDFDKVALPSRMTLTPRTVSKVMAYLVKQLPQEFRDASYHWQLSSSAGLFDASKVSAHLWFWLDRPVADGDLKRWAKHIKEVKGFELIDPSVFQHVQPHYTAAPIFKGMEDPFPARSGLVHGKQSCVVLKLPANVPPAPRARAVGHAVTAGAAAGGFDCHLSRIGDHPGGEGFHAPLRDAAASYVATHGAEKTDPEVLYELLRDAALRANRTGHSDAEVEARCSRDHILPLITSALRKYGDTGSKQGGRGKSSVYHGVPPHYSSELKSADAIQAELNKLLRPYGQTP